MNSLHMVKSITDCFLYHIKAWAASCVYRIKPRWKKLGQKILPSHWPHWHSSITGRTGLNRRAIINTWCYLGHSVNGPWHLGLLIGLVIIIRFARYLTIWYYHDTWVSIRYVLQFDTLILLSMFQTYCSLSWQIFETLSQKCCNRI